jgi:hypothetical protein
MTVSSIKKTQLPNVIPIEANDDTCWRKFGNLIQSVAITTLDVFFLLGSVFSSIPRIFTDATFSLLNFSCVLSWSFYVDQTKKNVEDVGFSLNNNNYLMALASFLKTAVIITSIGLAFLNCCAAIFRLANCLMITQKIYTFMRPFGLPSLVLIVFLDVLYYCLAKHTLNFKIEEDSLPQFFQSFFLKNNSKNKLGLCASYVRGCIDKDTWKHFIKHLPYAYTNKHKQEELYNKVLIPNITTQKTALVSNLFLRVLGELGMYISIVYPGTPIQASCWTVLSSLYTGQLLYQHYDQYKQRKLTSAITLS